MKKLGWYKKSPAKFLSGTIGMSFETKGAYAILLDLIYDGDGSCPDNAEWIRAIMGYGMSPQRWSRIKADLVERGKIRIHDGRIWNDAAQLLLSASSEDPKIIGQKKGQKKALFLGNRTNETNSLTPKLDQRTRARADDNRSESESESSVVKATKLDLLTQVDKIASILGTKPGKYWLTNYEKMLANDQLTFEDIVEAARSHQGDAQITSINVIRGLAIAKRNIRLQNNPTWKAPVHPAGVVITAASHPRDEWITSLEIFLRIGAWVNDSHGPNPCETKCVCPADLIAMARPQWERQGNHPEVVRDGTCYDPWTEAKPGVIFKKAMPFSSVR